ncbi:hypothetical protein N7541_009623 [Penicillium brevicompactum]|uniref:Plasma membrane fusion protein PRM1 n=1 Tax=Penicillium brevicompactum TaxID=5074 RepID=A0A9W9QQ05_PENBR|nr:hypothetical protein N7541_009623 [Penicillium brevicompactum]
MVYYYLVATLLAALNGLGVWHTLPLGNAPSTSLWRTIGSLEIATSIYGLKRVRPYVFTEDDATIGEDVYSYHSAAQEAYERAKLDLKRSSAAVSALSSSSSPFPTSSSSTTADYILDDTFWTTTEPQPSFNIHIWGPIFVGLFVLQVYVLITVLELKSRGAIRGQLDVSDLAGDVRECIDASRKNTFLLVETVNSLCAHVNGQREDLGSLSEVFNQMSWTSTANTEKIGDILRDAVKRMDQTCQQVVDIMTSTDTQLSEVRTRTRELWDRTKNFSDIPKNLAKLNSMLGKDISDGMDALRLSRGNREIFGAGGAAKNPASFDAPLSPGILAGMRASMDALSPSLSPRSSVSFNSQSTPSSQRPTPADPKPAAAVNPPPKTPSPKTNVVEPEEVQEREPMTWHSVRRPPPL